MINLHFFRLLLSLGLFLSVGVGAASVDDWPQWRHDATHSGASKSELPSELYLNWTLTLPTPQPSFVHDPRTQVDRSYEPVASDGRLYVPSMVSDSVSAYDLTNGKTLWTFFAEGPVRLAPAAWRDKLFIASDDGHLHCLEAKTGALVWKYRAVPDQRDDYRFLGNERMISRWPIRCAPVVHDDRVYFASGMWPFEGSYAFCLDAKTGSPIWVNRENSLIKDGMNDHGKQLDIGLSHVGYATILGNERVGFPAGRALPAIHDLKTGKREPYTTGYGKPQSGPKGHWFLCGAGNYFYSGGQGYVIDAKQLPTAPSENLELSALAKSQKISISELKQDLRTLGATINKIDDKSTVSAPPATADTLSSTARSKMKANERFFVDHHMKVEFDPAYTGREVGFFTPPVIADDFIYNSYPAEQKSKARLRTRGEYTFDHTPSVKTTARDLAKASFKTRFDRKGGFQTPQLRFPTTWELDAPFSVQIKAGTHLYGWADETLMSVNLSTSGKPTIDWRSKIEGRPYRMLAAEKRLIVVTEEGRIYCFGDKPTGEATNDAVQTHVTKTTTPIDIVDHAVAAKSHRDGGRALLVGTPEISTIERLVHAYDMQVIILETDVKKVAEMRRRLHAQGLYGSAAQIIHGTLANVHFPPYFSELTLVVDPGQAKNFENRLLTHLRPFSGVLASDTTLGFDAAIADTAEYESDRRGELTVIRRIAAPAGSAPWTHEAGTAANTFANTDDLVKPPFATLWFCGSGDRLATPEWDYTHQRNPTSLVSQGRMFVIAEHQTSCIDAYTGRLLWQAKIPKSVRTEILRWDHRKISRPFDRNHLVGKEFYYVFDDQKAYAFNVTDGSHHATFEVPSDLAKDAGAWREARLTGKHLLASFGDTLACLNGHTGAVTWRTIGTHPNVTFAVSPTTKTVFALDYANPSNNRRGAPSTTSPASSTLWAIDLDTGATRWKRTIEPVRIGGESTDALEWKFKSFTKPERTFTANVESYSDRDLKPTLVYNAKNDVLITVQNRANFLALSAEKGTTIWKIASDATKHNRTELPVFLQDRIVWAHQAVSVATGERIADFVPIKKQGCNRLIGNESIITTRSGFATYYNQKTGRQVQFQNVRSGCTNSLIPADGILSALNASHGCNCNYPIFTSFALVHMPKAATFDPQAKSIVDPNMVVANTDEAGEGSGKKKKAKSKKTRKKK